MSKELFLEHLGTRSDHPTPLRRLSIGLATLLDSPHRLTRTRDRGDHPRRVYPRLASGAIVIAGFSGGDREPDVDRVLPWISIKVDLEDGVVLLHRLGQRLERKEPSCALDRGRAPGTRDWPRHRPGRFDCHRGQCG